MQSLDPPLIYNWAPTDNFWGKFPAHVGALVLTYFSFWYLPWRPTKMFHGLLQVPYGFGIYVGYGVLINKLVYNDGYLLPW